MMPVADWVFRLQLCQIQVVKHSLPFLNNHGRFTIWDSSIIFFSISFLAFFLFDFILFYHQLFIGLLIAVFHLLF